jgi:hypothetical protein
MKDARHRIDALGRIFLRRSPFGNGYQTPGRSSLSGDSALRSNQGWIVDPGWATVSDKGLIDTGLACRRNGHRSGKAPSKVSDAAESGLWPSTEETRKCLTEGETCIRMARNVM